MRLKFFWYSVKKYYVSLGAVVDDTSIVEKFAVCQAEKPNL